METTEDAFLGGAVHLTQPKNGYRAGQDPVLLAAACAIEPGQSFVDLGSGVGTVGLCLQARVPGLQGLGLELDPRLVRLAQNNGLRAQQGDVLLVSPEQKVDWALSNPPFFTDGKGRPSPNAQRQAGRQGANIKAWVRAAMAWVKPRGRIGLILSSAQVPATLSALQPSFGGIVLKPLLGKTGMDRAERCLLLARQGSRSSFILAAPLAVRDRQGKLSTQAKSILSCPQNLPLPLVR